MREDTLTAKIEALYKQSLANLQKDDPSLCDEVVVAQHNIIEKLRSMLLDYGFEKQIMETRVDILKNKLAELQGKFKGKCL